MSKAIVAGVGMVKFCKPGQQQPYRVMASEAIKMALTDAGILYKNVQQAYASYVYGDSTCGQHAVYDVEQTGIPVFNVNNNCSSGSTAIYLARQAVEYGAVDCALAVGFEEMQPGALGSVWTDREDPLERSNEVLDRLGYSSAPIALRCFGAAGKVYLEKYDATPLLFAKIGAKTRSHAIRNPYALFKSPISAEEIIQGQIIYDDYLTRYMACPPTCGAAAAIICSEKFAREHSIGQRIAIAGQAMHTDEPGSWQDPITAVGSELTKKAASQAYELAGVGPNDIDVIELHDCFTINEAIVYEGLQLCGEGEATRLVEDGANTYGGKWVVNPSGGLMSKGHPLGATGVAQCCELVWHLRGQAGERQVPNARIALQHNLGLGGAGVVTIYEKR